MTDNKLLLKRSSTKKCFLAVLCLVLLTTSPFSIISTTALASTAAAVDKDKSEQGDNNGNSNNYKSSRIQNAIDRQLGIANIPEGQEQQQETKDIQAAITDTWSPFLPLEGQIRSDSSPVV